MRPCICDKPGCHLCKLYRTHPKYRDRWSKTTAVVTLAVGDAGRKLLDLTGPSIKAYAEKIGAAYHAVTGNPTDPAFPIADKWRAGDVLDRYERIIYIDADIVVRPDAPNLFDVVPVEALGMTDECRIGTHHRDHWQHLADVQRAMGFEVRQPGAYYNAGLYVASRQHRELFRRPDLTHRRHSDEQHALNARIHQDGVKVHHLGPELHWLHYFHRDTPTAPFAHYSGLTGDERISLIRAAVQPVPKSYLINLPRRADRLERALGECGRAGISPTIFPAVDGSALPLPVGWRDGAGAYGCRESHRRVLEQAIAAKLDTVMVFEDDVSFVPGFRAKLVELLATLPDDWDAVLIGGQHVDPPEETDCPGVLRCRNTHRTHGYVLRGEYILRLYQWWSSEAGHVDHVWGRHQGESRVYAPASWLCGQADGKSDINGRQLAERWWVPKKVLPRKGCGCGKKLL